MYLTGIHGKQIINIVSDVIAHTIQYKYNLLDLGHSRNGCFSRDVKNRAYTRQAIDVIIMVERSANAVIIPGEKAILYCNLLF
jgi:hypothetical protein